MHFKLKDVSNKTPRIPLVHGDEVERLQNELKKKKPKCSEYVRIEYHVFLWYSHSGEREPPKEINRKLHHHDRTQCGMVLDCPFMVLPEIVYIRAGGSVQPQFVLILNASSEPLVAINGNGKFLRGEEGLSRRGRIRRDEPGSDP